MTKKYRVLFHGLSDNEERFKSRMALLGAPPEVVDKMISMGTVVLKQDLTLEFSSRYAEAVREAGGIVEVQEHGYFEEATRPMNYIAPFKDFTMCPECGLKQQKSETCLRCGFRFVKPGNRSEQRNVSGN